jgi:hypothetical protein
VRQKMVHDSTTRPFSTPTGTSSNNRYGRVPLQMAMTQPFKQMHQPKWCQSSTGPC